MTFTVPDILVVEDEELNRDIMARRMRSREYTLRFAIDGQQALNQVADRKPDLILLDIMLPEIMGLQVLHTLRQDYSMVDLPIIMVTTVDEDARIVRALELGANDYVTKPINFPILLARIQSQLCLKQLAALNTEFLAAASHDLRRPLATIQDIVNQASHKLAGDQAYSRRQMLDDMHLICQSAGYMQNITDCILDIQASGFGQMRLTKAPLHMEQLVDDVVARNREFANDRKVSIISKHGASKLIAEADRSRIVQVLNNLMLFAIERCSVGDIITLAVKPADEDIYVGISDTGMHLSQRELDDLFDKHTELQDQAEDVEMRADSTLPLCKQLIEQHGGKAGATNNQQHGVTLWFSLPIFRLRPVS